MTLAASIRTLNAIQKDSIVRRPGTLAGMLRELSESLNETGTAYIVSGVSDTTAKKVYDAAHRGEVPVTVLQILDDVLILPELTSAVRFKRLSMQVNDTTSTVEAMQEDNRYRAPIGLISRTVYYRPCGAVSCPWPRAVQ